MMKKIIPFTCICLLTALHVGAQNFLNEEVREAFRETMAQVSAEVQAAGVVSDRPVTLLPPGVLVTEAPAMTATSAYLEGLLKAALTEGGLTMAEPVEQSVWENAVATIEIQERKGDDRVGVLDPAYLNRFGKLKLAQRIMTFDIVEVSSTADRVMVEFTLHLYDLETNTHEWGQSFVRRKYLRENVQGIVGLDAASREVLKEALGQARESLKESAKAKAVDTVVILPLSGDVDRYITQLTRDAVSQGGLTPRELPLNTEDEARMLLRNTPEQVDAAMVGAVRELYREDLPAANLEETRYKVMAEVQLALLQAGTLDVLWSDTLTVEKEFQDELGSVEMQLWEKLKTNPMYLLYGLGGLVVLILLLKIIKASQRVR